MNETSIKPFPSPGKVLVILLLIDIGIGVLHLMFSLNPEMGSFFNLAHEENLPTWYSSLQFLLVAGGGYYCYVVEKSVKENFSQGWLLVALCMLGLAIDETFQIHEALITMIMAGQAGENLRHFFGVTKDTGALLWTVVFGPLMILAGIGLMIFYHSRFQNNRWLYKFSFIPISLLALSAVLEFIEAKALSSFADDSMVRYGQLIFVEEMAEIFAASLFVWIHYQYGVWRRNAEENAYKN
jgi:hypothetical protein